MAYQYVSALVRTSRLDPAWVSADLSSMTLSSIFDTYADVYLTLSNPIDGNVFLSGTTLQSIMPLKLPSPTLTAWLASIGNGALPTTLVGPPTKATPVRYSDARQAQYKVDLTDRSKAVDAPGPYTVFPDLLMTKDGIDFASMTYFMLTTVNGYLHRSEGSLNGLYVVDGGKTSRIANNNHVGVLSFQGVGKIQQIPITPDMLYNPLPGGLFSKATYIKLPVSTSGKIALLSIGGYLHVMDSMYQRVGDFSIKVHTSRIPLAQRLYQSFGAIDLSSLPLEEGRGANQQWSTESLASDEVMKAYLTLSQSFVILLDADGIYRTEHMLASTAIPGIYFGGLSRRFPLLSSDGILMDYRIANEEGVYVYSCEPVQKSNLLFETTDWKNRLSVTGQREPSRPWSIGEGRLLEFGTLSQPVIG